MFQVHLINVPAFINNVMSLFRPFLKEKFLNKVPELPPVSFEKYSETKHEFCPKLQALGVRSSASAPRVLQIFFHCSGYEALYEHVPREALPREYGGKLGSTQDLAGESGYVTHRSGRSPLAASN